MAFENVMSFIAGAVDVAPPADVTSYTLEAGTAGVVGSVYEFDANGELVISTDDNVDSAVIALEAGDVGTTIRCAWIVPGAIYKAPCTDAAGAGVGRDPGVTNVIGSRAQINDTADGVDVQNVHAAENPLTIVRLDGRTAYVAFNTCVLSLNI